MHNRLDILAFSDKGNQASLAVAEKLFQLGRGQFYFNQLIQPPEEGQLERNAERTIVLLDYNRIGFWRRAQKVEPGQKAEPGLPPWTREVKYLYLIGLVSRSSESARQRCVAEIQVDIPRFMAGLPVIPAKPQSAVFTTQTVHDLRQSPR